MNREKKEPDLVAIARKMTEKAYAPYSGFRVGAALLSRCGQVFVGCNVENASYVLTICAERSAVFAAVASGIRDFQKIAIAVHGQDLPYPCGACLQVLCEWGDDLDLLLASESRCLESKLYEHLPKRFEPARLLGESGFQPVDRE